MFKKTSAYFNEHRNIVFNKQIGERLVPEYTKRSIYDIIYDELNRFEEQGNVSMEKIQEIITWKNATRL